MANGNVTSRLLGSRLSTRTRERLGSEEVDQEDTKGWGAFKDKDLEERWREEGQLLNMKLGCQQLLLLNSFWACFSCIQLMSGSKRSWAFRIDVAFLLVISSGVVMCLRRPMVKLYYLLISTWFIFAFLHGIGPWSYSCKGLIGACVASCHRHQRLLLATFNMDCSLQGQTSVHIVMATLLLSSRLIPALRMMFLNWILILAYVLASYWYNVVHAPYVYNSLDCVNTTAILFFVTLVAGRRKFFMEKGQRSRFFYDQQQKAETKKVFHILEYMVPFHVILPMLEKPDEPIAKQKPAASVLFVMIEGFDEHARHLGPEKLMQFLNDRFTLMDHVCSRHSVTKIETVGEEYVCAVGVVPEDDLEVGDFEGRSKVLGRLLQAAAEILAASKRTSQGSPVTFKMGMHTGPVVAGVIGQKLPRFRLFGDTVNTAARMMQKGESGSLQFGEETYRELPSWVQAEYRGKIEMKGKGQVDTWLYRPRERRKSVQFGDRHEETSLEVLGSRSPSRSPSRGFRSSILRSASSVLPRSISRTFSRVDSGEESPASPAVRRGTVGLNVLMRQDEVAQNSEQEEMSEKARQQEEKFQRVLRELHERSEFKVRSKKWWFSFFLRTPDFTSEIEDKFQRFYHEHTICKKLESRLDRQALALTILTAVEVFCCTFFDSLYYTGLGNPSWRGDSDGFARLPIFLACRGLIWLIIWIWQRLARVNSRLLRHPQESQLLLAASFALIAVLTLISYDAISHFSHPQEEERLFSFTNDPLWSMEAPKRKELLERKMSEHKRASGVFTLMLFPVYLLVATQHQFRFIHTNVFWLIPLTMVLTWRHWCGPAGYSCNLYLSYSSKMLLCLTSVLNSTMAWSGERNSRLRFLAQRAVQTSQQRIDAIASTLMPPLVMKEMRSLPLTAELPSHKYQKATIAQSDLCGFTKLASDLNPTDVVKFIGELFGKFDVLTDKHQVYKVETVGDAYIAGQADQPLTRRNHPTSVVLFGLEMVSEVHSWSASRGWSVSCRVGITHGACIGGIVGTEMQRYHLFGELMSELEVLESTAPEGSVQVSTACKSVVEEQMRAEGIPSQLVSFEPRPLPHLLTSKGDVVPLEKAGGATYIVRSNSMFRGWVGA